MVDGDLVVHFLTLIPGDLHVVELRKLSGATSLPYHETRAGELRLPGGGLIDLLTPYPAGASGARLWLARADLPATFPEYLATWGRPIRYRHTDAPYPLDAYQTIFARIPGSAEMPSGETIHRTSGDVTGTSGISVAPLTLHTGVSSLEAGEDPYPEWFEVPATTAALINHTRSHGGRVIAVGTTVGRALSRRSMRGACHIPAARGPSSSSAVTMRWVLSTG